MTDVHSPKIRIKNTAAIKGKDTRPEMLVRKFLHTHGYRYRLYDNNYPLTNESLTKGIKSFNPSPVLKAAYGRLLTSPIK